MIGFEQIGYMGRLGNQMFQFASTLGVAHRLNLDARFPIENCFQLQGSGPFDPQLGRNMQVKCDLLDCFDIDPVYFIPRRHIDCDKFFHESMFQYDRATENLSDGTFLYGYFQTEKYFLHIRDLIPKQFTFKQRIRGSAETYMENIRKSNQGSQIVSVHVRRGDYVRFPDHHPVCTRDYYNQAISKFSDIKDKKFLVFSDDVDWCRGEFQGHEFIICDNGDAFVELNLMSLCDHHIIANSSFSWWGAWLNPKPKRVVAPTKWFGPAIGKNPEDVYSPDWIKI